MNRLSQVVRAANLLISLYPVELIFLGRDEVHRGPEILFEARWIQISINRLELSPVDGLFLHQSQSGLVLEVHDDVVHFEILAIVVEILVLHLTEHVEAIAQPVALLLVVLYDQFEHLLVHVEYEFGTVFYLIVFQLRLVLDEELLNHKVELQSLFDLVARVLLVDAEHLRFAQFVLEATVDQI